MLPRTFTLIATTVVCTIGYSSQSFPKMDFSHVILRTRAKKKTEAADLAKMVHKLNIIYAVIDSKLNDTEKRLSRVKSETSQMLTSMERKIAGIENKTLSNNQVRLKLNKVQTDIATINNELHGKLQNAVNVSEKKMENMSTKLERLAKILLCRQHNGFAYDGRTNMCLKVFTSLLSNPSARIACGKQGPYGRLVIQDTTAKHEVVKTYLRTEGITKSVHVGGNRNSGGRFVWSNGREMGIRVEWCPSEPSDLTTKCVALWTSKGFCFDDIMCTGQKPYLCEIPMV